MIARQLADVLKKYGVSEVAAAGTPFDPQFHEAVMREESAKVPPGTVVQVLQRGYMLNDRLLRPAMVTVSAAPAAPAGEA
jgi:molecular chaperone GrpE